MHTHSHIIRVAVTVSYGVRMTKYRCGICGSEWWARDDGHPL